MEKQEPEPEQSFIPSVDTNVISKCCSDLFEDDNVEIETEAKSKSVFSPPKTICTGNMSSETSDDMNEINDVVAVIRDVVDQIIGKIEQAENASVEIFSFLNNANASAEKPVEHVESSLVEKNDKIREILISNNTVNEHEKQEQEEIAETEVNVTIGRNVSEEIALDTSNNSLKIAPATETFLEETTGAEQSGSNLKVSEEITESNHSQEEIDHASAIRIDSSKDKSRSDQLSEILNTNIVAENRLEMHEEAKEFEKNLPEADSSSGLNVTERRDANIKPLKESEDIDVQVGSSNIAEMPKDHSWKKSTDNIAIENVGKTNDTSFNKLSAAYVALASGKLAAKREKTVIHEIEEDRAERNPRINMAEKGNASLAGFEPATKATKGNEKSETGSSVGISDVGYVTLAAGKLAARREKAITREIKEDTLEREFLKTRNVVEEERSPALKIDRKEGDFSNEMPVGYVALAVSKLAARRERTIRREIEKDTADREAVQADGKKHVNLGESVITQVSSCDVSQKQMEKPDGKSISTKKAEPGNVSMVALAAAKFSVGREKAIQKRIENDLLNTEIDSLLETSDKVSCSSDSESSSSESSSSDSASSSDSNSSSDSDSSSDSESSSAEGL